MAVPDPNDSTVGHSKFDNTKLEYEDMSFEKRLDVGLSIDRSAENSLTGLFPSVVQTKCEKDPTMFLRYMESVTYRSFRDLNSWHTKRQINTKLVKSPRAHEHVIDLSRPILLDLLMTVQPTVRDWQDLSVIKKDPITNNTVSTPIDDRSTQRVMEYYPNIVFKFTGHHHLIMRNKDGSLDKYPKWPIRNDQSTYDERLQSIATPYCLPAYVGKLDTMVFADVNYLVRLKKYWQDMLAILSEIMLKKGPIRPEMEWIVYHIVNNDVALYVLFDNLSLEYELRWFQSELLLPETKIQIIGNPVIDESEPYFFTKNDAREGMSELQKFIKEFDDVQMPSILEQYKVSTKTMKKRIRELAIAAVDRYDSSKNYQQANFISEEITICGI